MPTVVLGSKVSLALPITNQMGQSTSLCCFPDLIPTWLSLDLQINRSFYPFRPGKYNVMVVAKNLVSFKEGAVELFVTKYFCKKPVLSVTKKSYVKVNSSFEDSPAIFWKGC